MFKKLNNAKYTQISIYIIAVATAIIAIYAIIDNVPYLLNQVLDKLGWVIRAARPVLIAIIFAYLLNPIQRFFERKLRKIKYFKNKPRKVIFISVAITMILLLAALSAIISILVFTITDQIKVANYDDIVELCNGYVNSINNLYDTVINWLNTANIESVEIQKYLQEVAVFLIEQLKSGSLVLVASVTNISSFVTSLVIAFVITIYILIDGSTMMLYVSRVSEALCSEKLDKKLKCLVADADIVFSGYVRGQFTDALVMLLFISVGLSIIGVKFAVIIGILAGIGNLIPYVGPFIAYAGVTLVSIFTGDWKTFLIAIIYLIVIQLIDGNIIGPKLLSNSIQIHPLLVIVFIMFGSAIGGFLGMLFAVPVGSLVKVLFMRYIDNRIDEKRARRELVQQEESEED